MGQAIGGTLPLAVGIALSPFPIIAVVLMLTTPRARSNGPAFVGGWLIGLAVVGAIVLAFAGGAKASSSGAPATWVSWVKIVLGVLLLLLAWRQFRGRPAPGEAASLPKWMGTIDQVKAPMALALGALLAAPLNPKNLILTLSAAATIAQTGISGTDQVIAYVVFALIATIGVAAPVVVYLAMGDRAADILGKLKDWLGHNNAVIMSVICLIIGAKLIGDAISALTA
jgi:Sap, sulfolipid-1-addressing protein